MNTYDLIICVPILIGFIFGLFRGFVKEVIAFGSIFLAIILAEMFNGRLTPYVTEMLGAERYAKIISYVVIIIVTILVALLVSRLIEKILSGISLGWLNSLLGGFFGALKIAIVVSLFVNLFEMVDTKFHVSDSTKKDTSIVYYPVLKLSPTLWKEAKKGYENHQQEITENEIGYDYE